MTTSDLGTSPAQSFPMQRCPFGPPAEYAAMRDEAPIVPIRLPTGRTVWAVTRHAEAQMLLTDPRISTDTTREGFPSLNGDGADVNAAIHPGMFIDMDPPEHDVYRRMLIPEFSVKRIRAMRPGIERTAHELIDAMLAGDRPADLVGGFGLPLPSLVICQLLGVPYEDREQFQSRTRRAVEYAFEPEVVGAAMMEIRAYLDDLVTRAEREPGDDDLLGRLIRERRATGELTHDELVGMTFLLLVAGHETTANMIPMSVLTLLRHPDQLAALKDDPSLWPAAVEELLRYQSVVDWVAFDRMAIEDIPLGDRTIRAGDGVYVLGFSANRDERAFPAADTFDIRRGARNHVAFGYGVHQCLGQNLARAELEIALEVLFTRIPDLRAAVDVEDLPFKYGAPIFGLAAFPVTW